MASITSRNPSLSGAQRNRNQAGALSAWPIDGAVPRFGAAIGGENGRREIRRRPSAYYLPTWRESNDLLLVRRPSTARVNRSGSSLPQRLMHFWRSTWCGESQRLALINAREQQRSA